MNSSKIKTEDTAIKVLKIRLNCSGCGAELNSATKFCTNCGIAIVQGGTEQIPAQIINIRCPRCGADSNPKTKFCVKCGSKLGQFEEQLIIDPIQNKDIIENKFKKNKVNLLNVSALRHEKEKLYLTIAAIASGVTWVLLILLVLMFIWVLPIVIFILWLRGQYLKAQIFGNAVKVSKEQFPKVAEIAEEIASKLNLTKTPYVFILSGQGVLNASAEKTLSKRYVLLHGELVDLLLKREAYDELKMVISHELAHHALGHTSIWKDLFLKPSLFIPFLGAAYNRACELSADRVGMILTENNEAAIRALLAFSLGSEMMAVTVDPEIFVKQEKFVPPITGFIYELYATHPRMTRRILELMKYKQRLGSTSGLAVGSTYLM